MNTEPQIGPPQGAATLPLTAQAVVVEPVTDDDLRAAQNIGERPGQIRLVAILEQDRRRVAERQAGRHSVGSTLRHTNVARLRELSHAVTQGPDAIRRECSMRVPAEPDRDADLVLSSAADEIERLRAEVAFRSSEIELFREELKRRCDEVAALKAAQANMIDATGAVEAVAQAWEWSNDPIHSLPTKARVIHSVPTEWAGSRVLIVRVAK